MEENNCPRVGRKQIGDAKNKANDFRVLRCMKPYYNCVGRRFETRYDHRVA